MDQAYPNQPDKRRGKREGRLSTKASRTIMGTIAWNEVAMQPWSLHAALPRSMLPQNLPNDKMRPIVYILNGPNLNLLGTRQPEVYGRETLADVEAECRRIGADLGLEIEFRQTNAEFQLIDWIHEARLRAAGIVINPAALSHTSVAVLDALNTCEFPILEVHITNIHRREEFRHHSFVSRVAQGVICGFGTQGYLLAIQHLARLIGS
jgi:3-dehydroquinate dehydratase II